MNRQTAKVEQELGEKITGGGGERLDIRLTRDAQGARAGVQEAARWLLRLHGSQGRTGPPEQPWCMFKELADALCRCAAAAPSQIERLVDMLERLTKLVEHHGAGEETQVRGEFHPGHLVLEQDAVCLTGLERIQQADPAQDLAEFVCMLRTAWYRAHGRLDQADLLTEAFLGEYGAVRPSVLSRVPFFHGCRILVSLCRHLVQPMADQSGRISADYYGREFEAALSGCAAGSAAPLGREQAEDEFRARAAHMTGPEFDERVVYPALFGKSYEEAGRPPYETSVPQEDRRTGRVTVGYRFGEEASVFGKVYPARDAHAFEVLHQLRATGFGEGPYQAVEPLAFLPDHNLLLTRAARGVPLLKFIGEQGAEVIESVRRAARWLVQLHSSPLRIGPQETVWQSMKLFSILRRLAKAAARKPHERDMLMERIDGLYRKAGENRERPTIVQVHGTFHYEHIYLSDETVTVIDFDQSFPADPAKDLTFFVTMLRRRTFKRTGSLATAQAPTRTFLEEYRDHLPANMRNLPLYWGAAILFDLFRYRKMEGKDELIAFLEEEYDAVLSGALIG